MLWETGAGIGHFVIVDGTDEDGFVLIRDPWQGTSYKMTKENFGQYWTTEAIFMRQLRQL
jgi:ABC-type bacteriocin/lantibiotic exporter with double-glycine peptidase domain